MPAKVIQFGEPSPPTLQELVEARGPEMMNKFVNEVVSALVQQWLAKNGQVVLEGVTAMQMTEVVKERLIERMVMSFFRE